MPLPPEGSQTHMWVLTHLIHFMGVSERGKYGVFCIVNTLITFGIETINIALLGGPVRQSLVRRHFILGQVPFIHKASIWLRATSGTWQNYILRPLQQLVAWHRPGFQPGTFHSFIKPALDWDPQSAMVVSVSSPHSTHHTIIVPWWRGREGLTQRLPLFPLYISEWSLTALALP